ncbi:7-cyano-7-deazaguanine synthase [Sulfurimonas sp. HSL-3221]|uniref:argininosuccinate synthase domain-containing protein n=1 Tax=Sulfurimonadaceae TaxID=2771471 RepID=UPI001E4BA90C|nr:argininosuccinate synthase domain-containing protein [Sulfurimonas sp. HSL-3221]UFS62634.1 7-cyano-7-deazaguanine synthase [Sulfurimonas sp. HSL-3221]
MSKRKAIALFSGGLDSTLAMKLIIDQGIDVIACNINTGFGATKDRRAHMQNMCDQVGAELRIIDIQSEYLQTVLFDPKHGYGKHFNPCIDCHAKMFEVAKRIMEAEGASFLISGEVLGQRPMSQNKDALIKVLNEANVDGLLLRPMSAKRLAPTIAEEEGWVDRDKLEGILGRSRERQMELAEQFGLEDYESPGGGCLLTDANFAIKIRDYIKFDEQFDVPDIPVLKWGRHFRLPEGAKMVIGRDQEENAKLQEIDNAKFMHIQTVGIPGPHVLLSKDASESDRAFAARSILTYCKTSPEEEYTLDVNGETVTTTPLAARAEAAKYSIL